MLPPQAGMLSSFSDLMLLVGEASGLQKVLTQQAQKFTFWDWPNLE